MEYNNIYEGIFLKRPNRFVAHCLVEGKETICHVKNTGRCKELLIPGAKVILEKAKGENRKTPYDLVSVYKNDRLVNMDSQAPNKLFYEWVKKSGLFKDITLIKKECTFASSRFDFYIEARGRKIFVEVKGVTLEEEGKVFFPDAPTERGVKHVKELLKAKEMGYDAYIVFVVQMKGVLSFSPNRKTHPAFAEALENAAKKGVSIVAVDCNVTENTARIDNFVPVVL